ncbi:LOW QUALITY PROTEIN: protein phosphatase 1 regulatory subunit 15A [Triplophysa dalaica]|uniref:LOW QUALITY PROTEIN: protein phosphatase 1 regulatory subunit 15A n=1 Tax=Triplophysa dalaica TaxID=1582913 RepID=UPI0024DFBD91|nr:LOW QUALITY PROTEIN: protein phosphatase 1 regulatory subunit 15A [Triplophysa dalaica]
MAPFTISPHHSLSYQCHLPQTAPCQRSKMSLELSSNTTGTPKDLRLSAYRRMSVSLTLLKIRLHLWQVIQRVQNCFMSVIELFGSNMFLLTYVGKNTAMMGELKKNSVVEAQERPGVEIMSGRLGSVELDKEIKDSEMELEDEELTTPAERQEWSMDDSEEEEEDEGQLSEWESEEEDDDEEEEEDNEEQTPHEETECDVDSEWSDDDDDDDKDSETSTESLELWESFFKSSDPYNPLSFSSCTASRTNTSSTTQNQLTPSSEIKQTEPTRDTNEEEHYPKPSTKKVRFNDKVTVRPLVAWSFAGRAARDGSCWMQMARDRERFRRRVESVDNIITPCLTPAHRTGVWERLQKKTSS